MVRVIYKGLHKIFKLSGLLMKSILYRVFQKSVPPPYLTWRSRDTMAYSPSCRVSCDLAWGAGGPGTIITQVSTFQRAWPANIRMKLYKNQGIEMIKVPANFQGNWPTNDKVTNELMLATCSPE